MKEVIRIGEVVQESEKPVEFTHYLEIRGWTNEIGSKPNHYDKILYLGNDLRDGDLFAAYEDACINIYKGHLNSGKY
jgi:hypothetical protein